MPRSTMYCSLFQAIICMSNAQILLRALILPVQILFNRPREGKPGRNNFGTQMGTTCRADSWKLYSWPSQLRAPPSHVAQVHVGRGDHACGWRTRNGKKTATIPSALMMGTMMLAAHHSRSIPIHTPLHTRYLPLSNAELKRSASWMWR